MQMIKLAAAIHMSITARIHTFVSNNNQPASMIRILSKIAIKPIFENNNPALHILFHFFQKYGLIQPFLISKS